MPDRFRAAVRAASAFSFCLGPMYLRDSSNSLSSHQNVPSSEPEPEQAALASSSSFESFATCVGARRRRASRGRTRAARRLLVRRLHRGLGLRRGLLGGDLGRRGLVRRLLRGLGGLLGLALGRALVDARGAQGLRVLGPEFNRVKFVRRPTRFAKPPPSGTPPWTTATLSFA